MHLAGMQRRNFQLMTAGGQFQRGLPLHRICAAYGDSAWDGKPVAVMGASVGPMGTSRAQYHLRQVFVFLNMYPLNRPEVMITSANQRFDEKGNLTDARIRKPIFRSYWARWWRGPSITTRRGGPRLPPREKPAHL